METEKALKTLSKTDEALQQIRTKLQPFLKQLSSDDDNAITTSDQRHKRAVTQAAVALSLGTVRFMGARLRGLDEGRRTDDPLRIELNKMRKLLSALQKKAPSTKEKPEQDSSTLETSAKKSLTDQKSTEETKGTTKTNKKDRTALSRVSKRKPDENTDMASRGGTPNKRSRKESR